MVYIIQEPRILLADRKKQLITAAGGLGNASATTVMKFFSRIIIISRPGNSNLKGEEEEVIFSPRRYNSAGFTALL